MSAPPIAPHRLWWLGAGFGIWVSALVALYAIHAIGCAFYWSTGPLRLGLGLLLLAHLIVIGWMWHAGGGIDPASGRTAAFLYAAIEWTVIAAFVATVLTLGPSLLLTLCR